MPIWLYPREQAKGSTDANREEEKNQILTNGFESLGENFGF